MSTKRKYQESAPQGIVHASRQFQVPGSKPTKKPRRFEPPQPKIQAHASSVNAIKKRIRDVRRRLDHADDLPADVRIEDERALAAYEQELAAADAEKTKQKMIKKYHMVRFFERQKATRLLKALRKRLLATESAEEVEMLKNQIHATEVDLNYAQYYPLSYVYVSLYPNNSPPGVERPKPPMWAEVERCMEDGSLDRLRNRAPNSRVSIPRKVQSKLAKSKTQDPPVETVGLNRRERRKLLVAKETAESKNKSVAFARNQSLAASEGTKRNMALDIEDGDDESDGGFFEE